MRQHRFPGLGQFFRRTQGGEAEAKTPSKPSYLSAMEVFQNLSPADMEWVDQVTTMRACPKGSILYEPGETGEVLFLLKKGRVQIYRLSAEGKRLILAILGDGTFFGEMALFGQGMYDAFAEATEDSLVCAMGRADVERLLLEKPQVALRVLQALGRRLLDTEAVAEGLALKRVAARLTSLLLRLAGDDNIVSGLSHQELADMVGTLRETATETLNQLRAAGLVAIGRKRIIILDREGLSRLAEDGGTFS
ncbi:MAG: Crp/Fnr family transcriptional regulator [Chloroflexi bacterium]|nr:Crp/Fnr family transcriptional regulator [Chloroflexota bacterium]